MSQSDLRVHVGLGRETAVTALEVRWANGPTTRYAIPKVDAAYTIDQKTGAVAAGRQSASGAQDRLRTAA